MTIPAFSRCTYGLKPTDNFTKLNAYILYNIYFLTVEACSFHDTDRKLITGNYI